MKTQNDRGQRQTWLKALAEAAKQQEFELPAFNVSGMGALRSVTTFGNRFVTLKRLLRSANSDEGVEWALWQQADDHPLLVAAFRDPSEPEPDRIEPTLMLIKGWLVAQWSADETKRMAGKHPGVQTSKAPPVTVTTD